jgi:hypothetical protein
MKNPFRDWPKRPPARILLYGDPGTEKTRRAIQEMPGPIAMIDLEAGSAYYGDIAPAGSAYLPTRSVRDVEDALLWLESPEAARIATVIVDPITVIWEQLQEGHRARMVARKKFQTPEEVLFDVGTWGRLGAVHGSIITRLCNLSAHVVCIGRGKEGIDDKGNKTGFQFTGQKNTPSLLSTVIETHAGSPDVVIKDRSGAYKEGRAPGRVSLAAIVASSGSAVTRMQTDTTAAEQDARQPDTNARPGDAEPTPMQTKIHAAVIELGLESMVGERWGMDRILWTTEIMREIGALTKSARESIQIAEASRAEPTDQPTNNSDITDGAP